MNKIKSYFNKRLTIIILFIATLGTGAFTSFAYFTDRVESKANLTIAMGNLDVEIVKPINIQGLDIDKSITSNFSVENAGTLNEKLDFQLDNPINIEEDGLTKLNYELIFKKDDVIVSKIYKGVLSELFLSSIKLVNENNEDIVIGKEEALEGIITITMDKTMPSKYSNKNVSFDMVITANQVNNLVSN